MRHGVYKVVSINGVITITRVLLFICYIHLLHATFASFASFSFNVFFLLYFTCVGLTMEGKRMSPRAMKSPTQTSCQWSLLMRTMRRVSTRHNRSSTPSWLHRQTAVISASCDLLKLCRSTLYDVYRPICSRINKFFMRLVA